MRHRIEKRLFGLFLASSIIFLTACSSKTSIDVEVKRPETDTNDFRMEELTKLTVGLSWNSDWYYEGIDAQNNPVYDLYKSAVNVEVVNQFALPWEGYEQQITSGIITGDIPDAFFAHQKMIDELIRNDLIVDIRPYYDQWATDELKATLEYNDEKNFSYVVRGDKLYGIPSIVDDCNRPIIWIRLDWLNELNSRAVPNGAIVYDTANQKRFHADGPKTLDEFWDLATAMAKEDPDNNTNVKTYGLSLSKNLDDLSLPIFNAYGCYPNMFENQEDGSYVNLGLDEKNKEPLLKLREMVANEVINSDYYNWDSQAALMKAGAGLVGMALAVPYSPLWPLSDVLVNKGDWIAAPMVTKDGSEFIPGRNLNASGYFVVRKGYEHPEVIIKMLNNMATVDESNDWYSGYFDIGSDPKNTQSVNWLPIRIDKSTINFERSSAFVHAIESFEKTGEYDLTMIEKRDMNTWNLVKSYYEKKDPVGWGMYKTFLEGVPVAKTYGENGSAGKYSDWIYPATDTLRAKGSSLEKMTNEMRIRIISGTWEISAFDSYVKDWISGGGKNILLEMEQAVKK